MNEMHLSRPEKTDGHTLALHGTVGRRGEARQKGWAGVSGRRAGSQ